MGQAPEDRPESVQGRLPPCARVCDSKEKGISVDPRAGQPADTSMPVNMPQMMTAHCTRRGDPAVREQRVAFETSGHSSSAFHGAFNEGHMLAITQTFCLDRVGTPD
jgi:hypothetical protein